MADIAVQRGTVDYSNSGSTATPGTSYGALASAFVRATNNRKMNAGRTDGSTSNTPIDDLGLGLAITAVDTITVSAESGSNSGHNRRCAWESWEYTGSGGGAYEFIVRSRDTVTLTGETNTATLSNTPSDIDNCIPFITGIRHNGTSSNFADCAAAIAWLSGSNTLNVKRGGTNGTVTVTVTTVEFTGSAWAVAHGRIESNADSGTITLVDDADGTTAGGGDISDWATAAIFHQFSGNNRDGVDDSLSDTSAIYEPGSNTTSVDWTFNSGHTDSAGAGDRNEHMVHVLQCDDLAVTRVSDTQSHTGAANVSISGASLTDIAEAGLIVSRQTSGNGNAYARGWVNARITSTTNVELWCHRNGNSIQTRLQVLDFSGMTDSGGSSQELTHTELDDADSFGSHTVTTSYAVTHTTLDEGDTTSGHAVTTSYALVGDRPENDPVFGSHAVSASYALTATEYESPNSVGAHSVDATYALTASTLDSGGSVGTHTVGQGGAPQELTTTTYAPGNAIGAHSLATTYALEATLLADSDTHPTHGLATSYTLVGTTYANPNAYGSHSLGTTYTIVAATLSSDWIGTPAVTREGDEGYRPAFTLDSYQLLTLLRIK